MIPTRTVWRPTLECFKKVNELHRKEEDFLNIIKILTIVRSNAPLVTSYVAIDNSKSIDIYEICQQVIILPCITRGPFMSQIL